MLWLSIFNTKSLTTLVIGAAQMLHHCSAVMNSIIAQHGKNWLLTLKTKGMLVEERNGYLEKYRFKLSSSKIRTHANTSARSSTSYMGSIWLNFKVVRLAG